MKTLQITLILLLLQTSVLFAQKIQIKEREFNKDNTISFCKSTEKLTANTANEQALLESITTPKEKLQSKLTRTVESDKYRHNYYKFFYQSIPIDGAEYVVHSSSDTIAFANGNIPIISGTEKEKPALVFEQAKEGLSKILNQEAAKSTKIVCDFTDKGIVWLYKNKSLSLAYKIFTKGKNVLIEGNYYIDAQNGNVLDFENFICTGHSTTTSPTNAAGTANTLYSGVQNITTDDNFNGGFRLREVRSGVNIITRNANNQWDPEAIVSAATDFWDNDNNWQAGEHGNDRYATDVHWATERVVDYWRIQHNRNSIDNNGMSAMGYIHTNDAWTVAHGPMDNAYWSTAKNSMFYGDGLFLGPFGAFDVIAHEFGHGINQYTGYVHGNGEQGALNEGFSDIWGATIENWAAPTKQAWIMGEDLQPGGGRNIATPLSTNNPDCFGGTNWVNTIGCTPTPNNDGCGVHTNSTVLSHWYYLVVTGGDGWNNGNTSHAPVGSGFHWVVNAIGWEKAAKIAYRTEQLLNQTADYAMARTMSIQAAKQLFGVGSCEEMAVTRAWYAVGVGADYSGASPFYMAGNPTLCNAEVYTINNGTGFTLPSNVIWSVSDPNIASITVIPNTNNNSIWLTKITSGTVVLTASIPTTGCYLPVVLTKTITATAGTTAPFIWPTIVDAEPCGTYMYAYTTTVPGGTYTWNLDGYEMITTVPQILLPQPGLAGQPTFPLSPGQHSLKVKVETTCGTPGYPIKPPPYKFTTSNCTPTRPAPGGDETLLNISPNPAISEVKVTLSSKNLYNTQQNYIQRINITDKAGAIKMQYRFSNGQNSQSINVSSLPTDVYIVNVFDGEKWLQSKLIIVK